MKVTLRLTAFAGLIYICDLLYPRFERLLLEQIPMSHRSEAISTLHWTLVLFVLYALYRIFKR